jgi:hypothetical protein
MYADTLKLYTKAHGSKTTNLIINLDHDEWILDDPEATLTSLGIGERSFQFIAFPVYEVSNSHRDLQKSRRKDRKNKERFVLIHVLSLFPLFYRK